MFSFRPLGGSVTTYQIIREAINYWTASGKEAVNISHSLSKLYHASLNILNSFANSYQCGDFSEVKP